jgi:adenylate cyclase
MERRLAAILAADVVGYSRLMGANEVGTLKSLEDHQHELVEPEVTARHGRIVKLMGDGILAEFPSVVGAVECACAVQRGMRKRNDEVPEDRRIQFRIGINLGDIIVRGDDVFGDGVNVAARLEGVARPGGVAISQSVRDHVGNRLDLLFRDKGDLRLKNIAEPVRVFDVVLDPSEAGGKSPAGHQLSPEKPSIAVLPFTNMSGDKEQEYFSDGISEDIITDLSKLSGLFVVGRHTSFAYKGKALHLEEVARDLGVHFLLEGSVRKAANRLRITAQLIDGTTGGHVWAERYDRDLTDIFAIQDEITRSIVNQLQVRLLHTECEAIAQPPTANVEAYSCYLKGRQFFHSATKSFLGLARQLFVRATQLDPDYARAYAGIANVDARLIGWYGQEIPEQRVLTNADKALSLDPMLAEAHAARADSMSFMDGHDPAEVIAGFDHALSLDPNSHDVNFLYARYCTRTGQFERAAPFYIRALEIQPDDYTSPAMLENILQPLGRLEEVVLYGEMAIKRAIEAMRQNPEWSRPAQLAAATAAGLGRREEAMGFLERSVALDPDDSQTLYNAACTWSKLGDTEKAFDLLDRWLPIAGREKRMWLSIDSDFDPIREDPRFVRLVELAAQTAQTALPATPQPS